MSGVLCRLFTELGRRINNVSGVFTRIILLPTSQPSHTSTTVANALTKETGKMFLVPPKKLDGVSL